MNFPKRNLSTKLSYRKKEKGAVRHLKCIRLEEKFQFIDSMYSNNFVNASYDNYCKWVLISLFLFFLVLRGAKIRSCGL